MDAPLLSTYPPTFISKMNREQLLECIQRLDIHPTITTVKTLKKEIYNHIGYKTKIHNTKLQKMKVESLDGPIRFIFFNDRFVTSCRQIKDYHIETYVINTTYGSQIIYQYQNGFWDCDVKISPFYTRQDIHEDLKNMRAACLILNTPALYIKMTMLSDYLVMDIIKHSVFVYLTYRLQH